MPSTTTTAYPSAETDSPAASDTVASFERYEDAQAAVDLLSDRGFPVERTRIVGRGVRTVETVVGRVTNGRAALTGAASGTWFGLMAALLIGLFAFRPAWLALVLTGALLGAASGALFGFLRHWSTRGHRDFSSIQTLSAARYDVLVRHELADDAMRILSAGRFPEAAPAAPTASER